MTIIPDHMKPDRYWDLQMAIAEYNNRNDEINELWALSECEGILDRLHEQRKQDIRNAEEDIMRLERY